MSPWLPLVCLLAVSALSAALPTGKACALEGVQFNPAGVTYMGFACYTRLGICKFPSLVHRAFEKGIPIYCSFF